MRSVQPNLCQSSAKFYRRVILLPHARPYCPSCRAQTYRDDIGHLLQLCQKDACEVGHEALKQRGTDGVRIERDYSGLS